MIPDRSRFHTLLLTSCLAGYAWLLYVVTSGQTNSTSIGVCLIKNITNIPCPSCGTTRSVVALLNGHLFESLLINPMGFLVASIMLMAPVWIAYDRATQGQTFFNFYKRSETFMQRPGAAIPLVLLVSMNWFWNISKGL